MQKKLERNLAKANLFHALNVRPSLDDLQERGIYKQNVQQQQQEQQQQRGRQQQQQQQQSRGAGHYQQPPQQQQQFSSSSSSSYPARSRAFHLTRLLLKSVASMSESGELTLHQKGSLKDLIVEQNAYILSAAEQFEQQNDVQQLKRALVALASRR